MTLQIPHYMRFGKTNHAPEEEEEVQENQSRTSLSLCLRGSSGKPITHLSRSMFAPLQKRDTSDLPPRLNFLFSNHAPLSFSHSLHSHFLFSNHALRKTSHQKKRRKFRKTNHAPLSLSVCGEVSENQSRSVLGFHF